MSIESSDAELGRAIFRGSFGGSGHSGSGRSGSGNATIMTGLALSDSVEGRVLVDTGGQTVAASQGVDLPCTCNVRAGDKVIITLVGNDPTVTGVVGRGDQQQGEIDGAQSSADAANKRAEEARRFAEEVDGKVSDAQADMDAAKRRAEQAKAAADAASRKADQTAADVDRKVKAAADAATQASANASAAAAKADQLSGKVTDVTTTVSGLSTKVEGAARDATSALTASSKTSQSLGALTSTVEQHYTEQQATAGKADRAARDAASSLDRVSKVEQTAAGIQTQVTAASKTAADALSKASTAQQTADAITTKVSKEYTSTRDADAKYASQSQLTQTAEGLTSKVTTAQRTADAAKTAASTAKQTADGLSVTVESHYAEQRATDAKAADAKAAAGRAQSTADGAVTKATSAQATADGLKASVTKAQTTADSAVKAASSAQQTADAITATVSRDYLSKAGASQSYASKSSVTQTADGIRSEVASTYQTKAGMSAYAEKSYVDQKAGSITQSVEAVMATANGAASSASKANSDLAALSKMATKTYTFATANIKGKYWTRLGSLVSGGDWSNFAIEVMSGDGYNGSSSQNSRMTIVIKDGWQGKPAAYGAFGVSVLRENCQGARVAVMASAGNTCDVWVYLPWKYANGQYTISGAYRSWTQSVLSQADAPTSGVAQDVAYRLNAEQLKADVADTYTTKTEFRQTADAITATVAKKLDSATAASTYAKQSTLTQTADGLSVKVTTAQRTADAAKTAASTAKQTADGAANAANGAKAAADKAQTTAAGAVQKGSSGISSLETALTFDRDGLSIFKKVNGAIQGFIAKVTGSAFQICNKSGTVLSRFADNRIDLGRNSQDTTISMCRDNVRIYSSSKGGAGSGGEVNASYILCDAPVGANNRSSFSIGFGAFSSDPANDLPRETPYVTLGVDDARDGDSVTLGAQSVRVNGVDWTARHGQATGTGQYPNLARWACSGGLCTVSITHCLDGDLPSWSSRTLATGLPRTAARAWNLACAQQLPDGTLRDLQVVVEPDGDSPGKAAKVTLTQKGGPGIPHGSWLFVSGTYPLAQDGDWYEPFG